MDNLYGIIKVLGILWFLKVAGIPIIKMLIGIFKGIKHRNIKQYIKKSKQSYFEKEALNTVYVGNKSY